MSLASETQHGFKVTTFIMVGLVIVFSILFHNTGGIAGLVRVVGIATSLWAFKNPRVGLYLLGFFCFYLDFVKKLAVTYGAQSMLAVMEVLAIQMLVLGTTVLGTIVQLVLLERRFNRTHLWILAFVTLITGGVLAISARYGVVSAVQISVNTGLYSGIILVMVAVFQGKDELIKFFDYILMLGIPWALYGSYQYFFGYADFEWEYAHTWFSAVSSLNMFSPEGARPFGFASGPQGFGVITQLMNYALWRAFLRERGNFLAGIACLLIGFGIFCSLQRTLLLQPIIFLGVYWAFKKPATTKLIYASGILLVVIGIICSPLIISKLETVTQSIKGDSGWASRVLNVNTFSDRLQGWGRLTKASTYTLFGKRISGEINDEEKKSGGEEYSHDMINMFLDEVGVFGLGVAVVIPIMALRFMHRKVWELVDEDEQSFARCMLATGIIQFGLASVAGSNLGTVPHNFVDWSLVGVVVTLVLQQHVVHSQPVRSRGEPLATAGKVRIPFNRSGSTYQ